MNYRAIYSSNGVLTDYSTALNDYYAGKAAISFVHTEDILFFGSFYPFNSIYLKLSKVALASAGLSVEYWTGSSWVVAAELFDETEGLTKSGYLTWQINRFKTGWSREDTRDNSGNERVTGLGGVNIYDMYWIRIKCTSSQAFDIDWVGHIFVNDSDIYTEYAELENSTLLTAVKTGKTNWEEQRVRASKLLIEDMIQRRIINDGSQIVDRRKLENMCVSKTAAIIYGLLGDDYLDQKKEADAEYLRRVKQSILHIDQNQDGDLSPEERRFRQGFLYR